MESKEIYDQVNKRYGSAAKSSSGRYERTVAKAFGYTEDELAGIPDGANLGLSCGNPIALAGLREGETVVDLGCGAGFDVFTAAKRVENTGKAIGVDMNKNMIDKANANKSKVNALNVEFVEGAITSIPLPDGIADCVISNCVVNLVPAAEKQRAFNETFRLLKPGGRLAISDILARREFTQEIRSSVALYVGCVAGASRVEEYDGFLKNAGFRDIVIVDTRNDLNVYFTAAQEEAPCCSTGATAKETFHGCCRSGQGKSDYGTESSTSADPDQDHDTLTPSEAKKQAAQLGITDLNEWAGSFQIYAVKPVMQ